ncbi:MAG: SUMF1/EgtB/PvdO family nonheme iron enzyme [Treponema sp.]|nr:SUMF1/EgtB/PvdO family nonheme iron enzyme [Treponema sp.]
MKKLLLVLIAVFGVLPLFAKGYADYLAEAKKYETQKKWVYALGSYYDALETDEAPENKKEADEGYAKLRDAILSGKPGFSSYDEFTVNDEWKKLVIDAEKYFSSVCCVDISQLYIVKDSVQLDRKTKTKTMTYGVKIGYKEGRRYETIKNVIVQGLKTMVDYYKKQYANFEVFVGWEEWPERSVSYKNNNVYNVNGALVYADVDMTEKRKYLPGLQVPGYEINKKVVFETGYYNAFCHRANLCLSDGEIYHDGKRGLYDFVVNIVDENGKELVKGKRWLLGTEAKESSYQIVFSGVSQAIADLIDSGKARANIAACYLAYGKYNPDKDDGHSRTFVNELPDVQIPLDKLAVPVVVSFDKEKISEAMVSINENGFAFQIHKTEVTQSLYSSVIVGANPSDFIGLEKPVDSVSWYDAIYFCNKLSQKCGYEPVYSVSGETDVAKWGYTPQQVASISVKIEQNLKADGFRLPTSDEWTFAAKGGQNFKYSGSDNLDEVGWCEENSDGETHPVAQKKPNGYGLYDMSGNVWEWVWDEPRGERNYSYSRGGGYSVTNGFHNRCLVSSEHSYYADIGVSYIGFRVARSLSEGERLENERRVEAERLENERIEQELREKPKRDFETKIENLFDYMVNVTVDGKAIQVYKTEVTEDLFYGVMNGDYNKNPNIPVSLPMGQGDVLLKVFEFCNKLSEIKGLKPVYKLNGTFKIDSSANGFRIPTFNEWKFAGKGGEKYKYAGSNNLDDVAWYARNSGGHLHPVAQKKPNGYGLYDMLGNLNELYHYSGTNFFTLGGGYDEDVPVFNVLNARVPGSTSKVYGFRIVRNMPK